MAVYEIRKGNLIPIKEKTINLEKDLQNLTEENLQTVFGLEFVRTEFGLYSLYIDTLAFDPENIKGSSLRLTLVSSLSHA